MAKDHIVDEVRRVREAQAAKYGFDVKAILAAARKRQRRSGHKVVVPAKEEGRRLTINHTKWKTRSRFAAGRLMMRGIGS